MEKGKRELSQNFHNPSHAGPTTPPSLLLSLQMPEEGFLASWLRGPAPETHHDVAAHEVQAPTLGSGDALGTTEDEARVALAALHTSVLAVRDREVGVAGLRARLGTDGVLAVGWAIQSWQKEKHR